MFAPSSCAVCSAGRPAPSTDNEFHFLMECEKFKSLRSSLFSKVELSNPKFATLSINEKFKMLLCPVSADLVKMVHRFVKSMFESREKYDAERSTLQ